MSIETEERRASPTLLDEDRFAEVLSFIASRAELHDRTAEFPHEAFARLHTIGAQALTVPTRFGGLGGGVADAVEVIERVGAADPSVGLILQWNYTNHLTLQRQDSPWPADLIEAVFRTAVSEGALINGLAVERELGSLSRGGIPATTAELQDDGSWIITGEKAYGTGISGLRWITVTASTTEPEPRVATFLLDNDTPGWTVLPTWDHLGLRASDTQGVLFEGTRVPGSRLVDIRDPRDGTAKLRNTGRLALPLLLAANYNGVSIATRDWLVRYLHTRVPTALGASLATVPRFHDRVGEIEASLQTSRALLRHAVTALGNGDTSLPGLAKHVATTTAIRITESALDLTGNPGLSRSNPLERHHRNAMVGRVHFPQSDFVVAALGRSALAAGAEPAERPGRAGAEPAERPGRAGAEPAERPGRAGAEPAERPGRAGAEPAERPGRAGAEPAERPGRAGAEPAERPGGAG
ncbi:acyl-CoA dehydrogenase family protein [Rhodococcoides yunnanense]|uniref:acyl-CoA dehydrogenase family protein n=1 Tax=Rhodococcoides yunnanense TaxID=278209 RepID=UPI0014738376|nr:acyl-CoA dehydrogenase family protein [Rhodococcus yunnanensis]